MKRILKHSMSMKGDTDTFTMFATDRIVHVGAQQQVDGAYICMWFERDESSNDEPPVERTFLVRGTGHPVEEPNAAYVGTAIMPGGIYVFHLYELVAHTL